MYYSNDYSNVFSTAMLGSLLVFYLIMFVISIIVYFVMVISWMKMFKKAGEAGWKAWIPVYHLYVLYKIALGNGWWFLVVLGSAITVVNLFVLVVGVMMQIRTCQNFGKGVGYGIFAIFVPFVAYPIIAFSDAEYNGEYCYLFSKK